MDLDLEVGGHSRCSDRHRGGQGLDLGLKFLYPRALLLPPSLLLLLLQQRLVCQRMRA